MFHLKSKRNSVFTSLPAGAEKVKPPVEGAELVAPPLDPAPNEKPPVFWPSWGAAPNMPPVDCCWLFCPNIVILLKLRQSSMTALVVSAKISCMYSPRVPDYGRVCMRSLQLFRKGAVRSHTVVRDLPSCNSPNASISIINQPSHAYKHTHSSPAVRYSFLAVL